MTATGPDRPAAAGDPGPSQAAASLPVVLFAVLAGTIGDLVDRRKFLLITQAIMLIAAAALGALAIAGLITTWTRLALLYQERLERARALNDPARPPAITHWLTA